MKNQNKTLHTVVCTIGITCGGFSGIASLINHQEELAFWALISAGWAFVALVS